MASMTPNERAIHYAKRLVKAYNRRVEADEIIKEINNLVYSESRVELPKEAKLEILTEVEKQLRIIKQKQEGNFSESVKSDKIDNGDILDLIGDMKKKAK